MKYLLIILGVMLFLYPLIESQEGILNGKDDKQFAEKLASGNYYDLAELMADKIATSSPNESQRQAAKCLKCSFLQIRGNNENDSEKKSALYKEAVECYRKMIPYAQGVEKLDLKQKMAQLLLDQARGFIMQAEEMSGQSKEELYKKAAPLLEESGTHFRELKVQADPAGSDLQPRDKSENERKRTEMAMARYTAWYGLCQILYFQGVCGRKENLDLCNRELEAFIWDYEGKEGAFYAMILRGMVLHEKEDYEQAIDSYDGVLKALQDTYLFKVDASKLRLSTGTVSADVIKIFDKFPLSSTATTEAIAKGQKWLINDTDTKRKYLVIQDKDTSNVFQILTHPTANALRLQACYYKTKCFVKWSRFGKAVETVNDFKKYLREIHKKEMEDEPLGQATILEMGKAYVGDGEYSKAIDVAQKIAEKRTYCGLMAKKLLAKWGSLDPNAIANAKNAYLVAMGLWDKDQYKEAILSFLKVIQYAKDERDIEMYALDAWEKMGQSFWFLSLYHESAFCYEILATKYGKYKKIVKQSSDKDQKKDQKVEVGDKAAYWAYRAYMESFKITGDNEDKEDYIRMRTYLTSNWKNSRYTLNRTFDEARDKERDIDDNAADASEKYRLVAKAYQDVKLEADQYEPALVSIPKCYYKAGELGLKKAGLDKKEEGTFAFPKEVEEDFTKSVDALKSYQEYAKKNQIPEMDMERKARRRESMAQSMFYLGRVYMLWNKKEEAISYLEQLRQEYPEQGEMLSGAVYFLVKLKIATDKLAEAEALVQDMEKEQGSKTGSSAATRYQSFAYYLIGKEYEKKAKAKEEELAKIEDEKKRQPVDEEWIQLLQKSVDNLYKWVIRKENAKPQDYDWAASKMALLGKMLLDRDMDEKAAVYYRQAYPLFNKCVNAFEEESKQEEMRIKMTQCSIMVKNWEKAVFLFYPLYHKDLDRREKKREEEGKINLGKNITTQRIDPIYLDYISQILTGLAEQNTFAKPKELFAFLLQHANRDIMDDLTEFFRKNNNEQNLFEKYRYFEESTRWIYTGKVPDDQEKKDMNERFQKEKKDWAGEKDKQAKLLNLYRERYLNTLQKYFPKDSAKSSEFNKVSDADAVKCIKRLSANLAYEFTSMLVDDVPRWKNPNIRFSFYDNPPWWDAKYRQIYIIYLKGDREQAKNLIETLRIQQSKMGGPKYSQKFTELLNKTK